MLKTLGSTGLPVSALGLGLAALGRPGYITLGHAQDLDHNYDVVAMQTQAFTVLDVAWAGGVRYFDTARSYGRAEEFLGNWLSRRRASLSKMLYSVGSKWGYTYTADWQTGAAVHEVKEHTLPVLERQYAESRGLLGDQLRLYQVHSATLDSGLFTDSALLNRLAALKADGLVIGLSLSGPQQADTLRAVLDVQIDGRRLFDSVQVTWNLLERSTSVVLADAHAAGMGIIVKEALANGRLTARNTDPAFAASATALRQQSARLNTSLDALALAAVLAQPWADVVLSGATTVDQLNSNLRALDVRWDDDAESALAGLVETPPVYWDTRKRLAWN